MAHVLVIMAAIVIGVLIMGARFLIAYVLDQRDERAYRRLNPDIVKIRAERRAERARRLAGH